MTTDPRMAYSSTFTTWDERPVYSVWKFMVPHAIRRGLTEWEAGRFMMRQRQDWLYRVECDVPLEAQHG